jgi:putative hydrolase of the HAD superfamily
MKPHRSIFEAALKLAGVSAAEAMMVGDSLTQDIDGARGVGMRGVLVRRSGTEVSTPHTDVPVIRSLAELTGLL